MPEEGTRAHKTHDKILAGAERVFSENGFEASSMEAIAAAARVSKITLYRHFESKERLFSSVIQRMCERIFATDSEVALERTSLEDSLKKFAERMLAVVFDPSTLVLHRIAVAEAGRFPAIGELFYRSGPQAAIDELERLLSDPMNRRRLRIDDPGLAAETFMATIRGYWHLRLLLGIDKMVDHFTIQKQINAAIHLLIDD